MQPSLPPPVFQERRLYNPSCSNRWKPPALFFLLHRYLRPQLPCLGGCDVTGGISNVILVLRRERSRKCLINNTALCSRRPEFLGCPRWKGLFKESLGSIRARWKPRGVHESDGGYLILISMCISLRHGAHIETLSYTSYTVMFSWI